MLRIGRDSSHSILYLAYRGGFPYPMDNLSVKTGPLAVPNVQMAVPAVSRMV